jgi:uncharacterized protein
MLDENWSDTHKTPLGPDLQNAPVMRLSRFNVYLADFPEPGDTLIYNHLSGGMVPVTAEGMALLRRIDAGEPTTEAELAEVAELEDPDYGVLVPNVAEDERRFAARMDQLRKNKRHLSVTISTSLACNFGCTYCCQGQVMDGQTMKFETIHLVGKWIVERMKSEGVESVDLCFLGGEPLLHPHVIEGIVRQVGKAARATNVEFGWEIITNGYFLDRTMAKRLRDQGCRYAKVTLDGDETTHDKTRPLKRGKSSFHTIWNNLKEASKVLPIFLNGNYTEGTLGGFPRLIEKLKAAGFTREQIPLVALKPALNGLASPVESSGCRGARHSDNDAAMMMGLSDHVEDAGFSSAIDGLSLGPCGYHNANHFGIDPDGYVYKCSGFLGMPNWAIGHVARPEEPLGAFYRQAISPRTLMECGSCANRPSCAGGCVASALINGGSAGDVQCDKPYFQTVGVEAIKRKWRRDQREAAQEAAAA